MAAVFDLKNPAPAAFDIVLGGTPLSGEAKPYVAGVTVDDTVDVPSMFALELVSRGAGDDGDWLEDPAMFAPGTVVEIKLGYGDTLDTVMVGEITGLEPEFVFNRRPSLVVRGYDRRHRLLRGTRTRTFVNQTDSQIASAVAEGAGLTPVVEATTVEHAYVIQFNQTDFEFLQQRARRIQYEVMMDDKQLFFRPVGNAAREVMTLTLADHLLEFYPRLSAATQLTRVTARAWDVAGKKAITGAAASGDEGTQMGGRQGGAAVAESAFGAADSTLVAEPGLTQAEADALAKSYFQRRSLAFIEGEGVCRGRTDLRAGKVIKLDRLGERFSGDYYVTAAAHRYDARAGYRTSFTARRNAL